MKQNEEAVLEWTGLSEGGYVNNKKDPGGPTDRGVTQTTYNAWRKLSGKTPKTVQGISKTEANEIFVSQYLSPIKFNELPSGLDYAVADFSINSGPSRAVKELQSVLGEQQDGVIGLRTLAAIKATNLQLLITNYCKRRLSFMQSLKTWNTFKNGWTVRVMGQINGQQDTDIGVIDRAVRLSKANVFIPAPVAVGSGKASEASQKLCVSVLEASLAVMRLYK